MTATFHSLETKEKTQPHNSWTRTQLPPLLVRACPGGRRERQRYFFFFISNTLIITVPYFHIFKLSLKSLNQRQTMKVLKTQ